MSGLTHFFKDLLETVVFVAALHHFLFDRNCPLAAISRKGEQLPEGGGGSARGRGGGRGKGLRAADIVTSFKGSIVPFFLKKRKKRQALKCAIQDQNFSSDCLMAQFLDEKTNKLAKNQASDIQFDAELRLGHSATMQCRLSQDTQAWSRS